MGCRLPGGWPLSFLGVLMVVTTAAKEGALGAPCHFWEQRVVCGSRRFLIAARRGYSEDSQKVAEEVTWRALICRVQREVGRCEMIRLIFVSLF